MQNELCVFGLFVAACAVLYDGVHRVHFIQHVLCKGNLAARTDKVMLRLFDLKVLIANDVVREEARCKLAGKRKAAERQRIHFGFRQRRGGLFKEALGKCPENIEVYAGLFRMIAIFFHKICSKADGIAEIVADKARA